MRGLLRSRAAFLTTGLLIGVILVGSMGAVGASGDSGFTGCLTPGGDVTNVAEGSSPAKECKGNSVQISVSSAEAVTALRADVDALLNIIQIDPGTGAVTIVSPDELTLDAADGEMVMIMDETMIEADTTVMGDTDLMEDATIMGETVLEDDVMAMEDVMVMADTSLEGQLILPDQAGVVDGDGVLTPTASAMTIDSDGFPPVFIRGIAPGQPGAILELRFEGPSDEYLGAVIPAFIFSSTPPFRNIRLSQRPFEPYEFGPGDTLRLRFDGFVWQEVSRSSGVIEVYFVQEEITIPRGSTRSVELGCTDEFSDEGGRIGGILLNSSVNPLFDPLDKVDVVEQRTEMFPSGGPGGEDIEIAFFRIANTGANFDPPITVNVALRCLQP